MFVNIVICILIKLVVNTFNSNLIKKNVNLNDSLKHIGRHEVVHFNWLLNAVSLVLILRLWVQAKLSEQLSFIFLLPGGRGRGLKWYTDPE